MADLAALPPQALEVERQVLGACLLDPRAAERAVAQVSPAEFYSGAHRAVFGAVAALALAERKVDHHTVLEELRRQGRLEELAGVGGDPEAAARLLLTGMLADLASPEHVVDHCAILRERSRRRRCLVAAAELARAGAEVQDTDELLSQVRTKVEELDRGAGAIDLPRMSDAYGDLLGLSEGPPADILRPAGFEPLLDLLPGKGLWRGLYVLGGPAGVGKTTLTMQMAEACLRGDEHASILYVSGEMSSADLYLSCTCRQAQLDYSRVLAGELGPDERDLYCRTITDLGNLLRRVWFSRDMRVGALGTWLRRYRPSLLIVDYLQQLKPADGERDYTMAKDRIDAVARGLMELRDRNPGLPIWLLASHSRGEAKKPYAPGRGLGAYKETGDIEYSADRCLNLEYTDEEYQRWRDGTGGQFLDLNLVVLKNRMGKLGRVAVGFAPAAQRFELRLGKAYAPSAPPPAGEDPDA